MRDAKREEKRTGAVREKRTGHNEDSLKDTPPKCDKRIRMNHQEHNLFWKVWIDVMRLCYEVCHVL